MNNDTYGSAFREAMKTSMEKPMMREFTLTHMSRTTAPLGALRDRRSRQPLIRMRRIWWHLSDSIGLFLWLVVGLMVAVMARGCFIGFERWVR